MKGFIMKEIRVREVEKNFYRNKDYSFNPDARIVPRVVTNGSESHVEFDNFEDLGFEDEEF